MFNKSITSIPKISIAIELEKWYKICKCKEILKNMDMIKHNYKYYEELINKWLI